MKRQLLALIFLIAGATLAGPVFGADRSQDEAAIRDVQTRQAEAWNRRDAKAAAKLFTEDGDLVNIFGWWLKGRSEMEKTLTDAFVYVFRDSTLTIDGVQIRFLTSRIAVAHVRWSMVGARTPAGIPEPRNGIQTQILHKHKGKWLIAAFQNTNSVPEIPFPKGPPAAP
jgi:uncharacterized protein (TIGR02246 family)